jgi:hypothetical protein
MAYFETFRNVCVLVFLIVCSLIFWNDKYSKETISALEQTPKTQEARGDSRAFDPIALDQNHTKDDKKCSIINEHAEQFYAEIGGERYPKLVPAYYNTSINFTCLSESSNTTKKILILYPAREIYLYDEKTFLANCPITNCEISRNWSYLKDSDLVLVQTGYYMNRSDFPPKNMSSKTRLVYLTAESMVHTYSPFFKKLNGVFNLTATFKFDSDFVSMYYSKIGFKWQLNKTFDPNHDFLSGKTNLAYILLSNCYSHSNRYVLIKEMRKYAPIGMIGKCNNISCNITNENQYNFNHSRECRRKMSPKYMFMLAFENSLCEDYITEKFYDSLLFDIVPVVYGAGDYTKWIPKSAYIDVRDFKSVPDLVNYMLYLSKNATAYNSYFSWKRYIVSADPRPKLLCEMCIKLQLETIYGIKKKTVDIDAYWDSAKKCKSMKYPSNFTTFEMKNLF